MVIESKEGETMKARKVTVWVVGMGDRCEYARRRQGLNGAISTYIVDRHDPLFAAVQVPRGEMSCREVVAWQPGTLALVRKLVDCRGVMQTARIYELQEALEGRV